MEDQNNEKLSLDEFHRVLDELDEGNADIDTEKHINPLVEEELLKTLTRFFNEIDLVFDYIDRSILDKLKSYLKTLSNIEIMKTFVTETVNVLQPYADDISKIVTSQRKLKTSEFEFMDKIILFGGILSFSSFSDENKNTKRSLVKYLYNIYMSVFILNLTIQSGSNIDTFTKQMTEFVKGIQDRQNQEKQEQNQQKEKQKTKPLSRNTSQGIPQGIPQPQGMTQGVPNFGNLLGSLMQNGEIMNLATDLSRDIQSQNIDPMMLLSSIMTGKPDDRVQDLITNISSKIETKINSGEIDKDILEQQAQTILSSVQGSNGDVTKMFGGL